MIKVRCPICQQPMESACPKDSPHYPFCSRRCRLIDLKRWLDEEYRFPAEEEAPNEEDQSNHPF